MFTTLFRRTRNRCAPQKSRTNWRLALEPLEDRIVPESAAVLPVANDFVNTLYRLLLARTPQATEVAGWVEVLQRGGSATQVAEGFLSSPEYGTNTVRGWYHDLLGRAPEPSVMSWWLGNGNIIGFDEHLLTRMLEADEYYLRHGGNALGWVTSLYGTVLSRDPDAPGLVYWVALLNAGVSRLDIAQGFVDSQ